MTETEPTTAIEPKPAATPAPTGRPSPATPSDATGRSRSTAWPSATSRRARSTSTSTAVGSSAPSRASASSGRSAIGSGSRAPTSRPEEVIATWKSEFGSFWPKGNQLLRSDHRASPRARWPLLNLAVPGRQTLSTGVMVIYADEESFTFMTPEGHMFAAWITFSAFREDEHHGRPDRGPAARQRPAVRDLDGPSSATTAGERLLAGDAPQPGRPVRCRRDRRRWSRPASTAGASGRTRGTSGTTRPSARRPGPQTHPRHWFRRTDEA